MSKPITMKPGVVYKVRKPFQLSTIYKLLNFCQENGLRFGQALAIALTNDDLFFIENEDLEARIGKLISARGK